MSIFKTQLSAESVVFSILKKENNGNIYYNGNFPKAFTKIEGHTLVNTSFDECTHIVKKGTIDEVYNEVFFTWLSAQCGIATCRSNVLKINEFDWAYATENFCPKETLISLDSLLGQPKRHIFSFSLKEVLALFNNSVETQKEIFNRVFFSWLINNYDLHTKNISFLCSPQGALAIAPSYDLLCLAPYYNGAEMNALKINSKNEQILPSDFFQDLAEVGVSDILAFKKNALELAKKIPKHLLCIKNTELPESHVGLILSAVLKRVNEAIKYCDEPSSKVKRFFIFSPQSKKISIDDLKFPETIMSNSIEYQLKIEQQISANSIQTFLSEHHDNQNAKTETLK